MLTHGWRFLLCVALLTMLGGCSGFGSSKSHDSYAGNFGPPRQGPAANSAETGYPSGVVRTSATEGPNSAGAVIPATGARSPVVLSPELVSADDDDDGFQIADLAPDAIYRKLRDAAGYGPNEGVARALIEEGEALFSDASVLRKQPPQQAAAARKFEEAAEKFEAAAKRWPDSAIEEDAMFLLGESQFYSDDYPKAQDSYDKLLKKYDNSRYLDTVVKRMFAIGQYWEGIHRKDPHWPITPNITDGTRPTFDTRGRALKAYKSIWLQDPTGELADDAIMAMATACYNQRKYIDAAEYYNMLISNSDYAKSPHQLNAHLYGVKSYWQMYQGGDYDKTPLEKADRLAAQAITQFGAQLGEDLPQLRKIRAAIEERRAERELATAELWAQKKDYGAARIYYQSILDQYPKTQAAGRARQRIDQFRGRPDVPPNHFEWLTNLFPEG